MDDAATESAGAYRVLARKYRPSSFEDIIGQDVLVRTLSNALESGRLAQAWMLTGVRGVGKTTTARIIAKALNCVQGPTPHPCGVCETCIAIAADRHVDVIEMDAASNTGVENVRTVIEGARYAPVSARFKIYIIDEVHMLSRQAFNALLKTLEEPPPHVKFVFATTEIRKVPVTVLSRCQRFDLRRITTAELADLLTRIATKEGMTLEEDAAALLARAGDGSARDAISLLDQSIVRAESGSVTADAVRNMLGINARDGAALLLDCLLTAKPAEALEQAADLRQSGADAVTVLQDLAGLVHLLTRARLAPQQALSDPLLPQAERELAQRLAPGLSLAELTRAWQILLKGLGEVQSAPDSWAAAEMVLVRLGYAASLPTPAELIRELRREPPSLGGPTLPASTGGGRVVAGTSISGNEGGAIALSLPSHRAQGTQTVATRGNLALAITPSQSASPEIALAPCPVTFEDLVVLFEQRREPVLRAQLYKHAHKVHIEPGRLELRLEADAAPDLSSRVARCLTQWTGQRWVVSLASSGGDPTLAEQEEAQTQRLRERALATPIVQEVMAQFPGATLAAVRPAPTPTAPSFEESGPLTNDGMVETDMDLGSFLFD
ncbi:MAG: DNA polymerase III subunit gamma/tau [Alphaproteobacteria bacterium]|nr:MAG: DNA polymerase III subunit gamma/tau [Alphaproteobacteria bacterium]